MPKMTHLLCLASLLCASILPAQAEETSALRPQTKRPAVKRPKLVTMDFVNADLVYVLKMLAREMGRNVYVGPGVEGTVTVTLKAVPVDGAVALILKMQAKDLAYKLVGYDTLIVATPDKVSQIEDDIMALKLHQGSSSNNIRQENR